MRTPSRVRGACNLAAGVMLWLGMTSSAPANELFPGGAPADWRDAAKAVLTDHAEVVPVTGPWFVAGPFDPEAFSPPFPPEADLVDLNPQATYRSQTGTELRWQRTEIPAGADFDLRRLCPDHRRNGTFYLLRTLTVDRECVVPSAMRGMSGLTVWVNDKQLVDRGPGDGWLGGGWEPKEALLVPLVRGVNRLLVKVEGLHKNSRWVFWHGTPEPGALRYTLSMTLPRAYPGAAAPLGWLQRDGLDLLQLEPEQRRGAEFNQRLPQATDAALARADAWIAFVRAANAPERDYAQAAGVLAATRRGLQEGRPALPIYFAANSACQRLESLPQAQVIHNWLRLDDLSVLSPMDDRVRAAVAAALLRGERLLQDFGPQLSARGDASAAARWQERLGQLRQRLESLSGKTDPAAVRQLFVDAHTAVRELVFANPLLGVGKLVFYKRCAPRTMNIHRHQFPSARYMDWPAQPGGELCVLAELRPDAQPQPLLRGRLGRGIIRGYDLSYDAQRIVFGFWNADVKRSAPPARFEYDCYVTEGHTNLYELNLERDEIRQLTSEPWHDVDPCYLPNGRIAFASERCGHNAQCDPDPWSEPMVNLYTLGPDLGDVRRLSSHKDADDFPRVLNDGRVVYTRWAYHERGGLLRTQTLWASRTDGTQEGALFKEHLDVPFSLEEARAVPDTEYLVAVATGHHTNPAGAVLRIDLRHGVSAREAMQIVTPGVCEFEGGLGGVPVPEGGVGGYGYYSTPWPLSEKYFLVAYNPGRYPIGGAVAKKDIPWGHYLVGVPDVDMTRAEGYGLYVIDVYGNRELIYRDPEISCFSPMPLAPRPAPPVLPDATDPHSDHATLVVTDVHQGLDVPTGTVKYLRVSEALPWPYTKLGAYRYPRDFDYTLKRTIGLVPVAADGSAHFTVPPNVGLYFQALDEQFIEVRRMRSLVSFQPGERRACTGCHETRDTAPTPARVQVAQRPPVQPEPPPWGSERPISFLRDVQPVLDKRCVSCHSGTKPAGKVDLFPGLTGPAHDRAHCTSFDALSPFVSRSHVPFAETNSRIQFDLTQPYQFGSGKSRLVSLLKQGHEGVELSRDEWLTLLTWIDNNGLYLGSFVSVHDWGRWGYRPEPADMEAIRAIQKRRCAACHAGVDLARPGWIDPRQPRGSVFVLAPLARPAGGWGKCEPPVFRDAHDPDYLRLVDETSRIWTRMRQDPTPDMKELIAAEPVRISAQLQDDPLNVNRFQIRQGAVALVAMMSGLLPLAGAADTGRSVQPAQGLFGGLPSQPGPHVEKIKALADNSWLELGSPAPDPAWGRARGRSWTSEMPLAPELRGAFLYGEGQHGYTKPDGHYMDDLWFYDIHAHRWICCYPGAPTKTLRLQLNADGWEAAPDGALVPVAQQVHGYEMNTYDPDAKRLLSMPNTHPYWEKAVPQRKDWLKPPPADASPWFYETAVGKWNRLRTGTPGPQSSYGDTLIYLPGRKQAFFLHRNQDVWIYDTQANAWQNVAPTGPPPPFGIDATSCYDSRRQRIYIGGGSYPVAPSGTQAFWVYDLKTHTWTDPQPKGRPCQGSNSYPTKNAVMVYEPRHDRVLLVFHSYHDDTPEKLGVYVYDPNANAWAEDVLPVPGKLGHNRQAKNGFYDPELNAVFIHSAGDSQDDGTIWVYRYQH